MALRFMQLGDLHLGAKLAALPADVAAALRQAVRDAVVDAFTAAARNGVELVLLPGDLFESDGIEPAEQLRFVYEQAARLAPVPVVVTPGNHDAYDAESAYATETPPDNVVLFAGPQFTLCETPVGPVVGRAVQPGEGRDAVDWSGLPRPAAGGTSLLVMHATVLSHADQALWREHTAPVTLAALADSGYSYVALGHYHEHRRWQRGDSALTYAAYAGCPQGLGWDECGPRGHLLGTLDRRGAELEFIPLSRHIWHRVSLGLPADYLPDADTRLAAELKALHESLGGGDLLRISVYGRWPEDDRASLKERLAETCTRAWHSPGADLSAVDFHPPLLGRGRSQAVDAFLDRCDVALANADEEEREIWSLVRYLGLRLLSAQGLPREVA